MTAGNVELHLKAHHHSFSRVSMKKRENTVQEIFVTIRINSVPLKPSPF